MASLPFFGAQILMANMAKSQAAGRVHIGPGRFNLHGMRLLRCNGNMHGGNPIAKS